MKKARKAVAKKISKRASARTKSRKTRVAAPHKPARASRKKAPGRPSSTASSTRGTRGAGALQAGSTATLAASVISRRAARNESRAVAMPVDRAPVKTELKTVHTPAARHPKSGTARTHKGHSSGGVPGNRAVVRSARAPQFNYMRAPGADNGFDVGDGVEVFCDHEQEGERVRGWVKGVVVQVDNKLVAVQFRSNVFLTDGWMVPDRILWYSLGSDQIRGTGLGKKAVRAVLPEY